MKEEAETGTDGIEKIDLNDATFKELAQCASRIVPLLAKAHGRGDKDMVAVFDDMLSALYALVDAHKLGFKGKTSESEYEPIEKRSKQVSNGEVKRVGSWMAGFHFNNGMFRISALFARLVIRLGAKSKEQDARDAAAAAFLAKMQTRWVNDEAQAIRKEVNNLKHEVGGVFKGRAEDMATAITAISQLLTLAEALY